MNYTIKISIPDNCSVCGCKLIPFRKTEKDGWTIIERICSGDDCKKLEKISIKTTFDESDRDLLYELFIAGDEQKYEDLRTINE